MRTRTTTLYYIILTLVFALLSGETNAESMSIGSPCSKKKDNTYILKKSRDFESQVVLPNVTYIIRHNYDLRGAVVEIPDSCTLVFEGGKLCNGTISGCIRNASIESAWFESDDDFVRSIAQLEGFEKLVFENREYLLSTPLTIRTSCTVIGNGAVIKRIDATNDGSKQVLDICDPIDSLRVENLMFDGSVTHNIIKLTAPKEVNRGLYIGNVKIVILQNVSIINFNIAPYDRQKKGREALIKIEGFNRVYIDGLKMRNNRVDADAIWLLPCDMTGDTRDCIDFLNSDIDGRFWSALCCYGRMTFYNNTIRYSAGSALNCFCSNSRFEKNTFSKLLQSYVFDFSEKVDDPYHEPKNVVVTGNSITNSGCSLVRAVNGKNIEITDNYVECSTDRFTSRILDIPGCRDVKFSGNTIINARRLLTTDEEFRDHAISNITITENVFRNDEDYETAVKGYIGLFSSASNVVISDNIFDFQKAGNVIRFYNRGSKFQDVRIEGNEFRCIQLNGDLITNSIMDGGEQSEFTAVTIRHNTSTSRQKTSWTRTENTSKIEIINNTNFEIREK